MSGIHAEGPERTPGAEIVAVASPSEGHARSFAESRVGEYGRVVMEILFVAYRSAADGRRADLSLATDVARPIDPWKV